MEVKPYSQTVQNTCTTVDVGLLYSNKKRKCKTAILLANEPKHQAIKADLLTCVSPDICTIDDIPKGAGIQTTYTTCTRY